MDRSSDGDCGVNLALGAALMGEGKAAESKAGAAGNGGHVANMSVDPVIQTYREQIAALDLTIVKTLNARIKLVKSLKDYKEAQALDFYDSAQEKRVLTRACQANHGPASDEGLRELYGFILEWTKREVAGLGDAKAE